MAERAINFTAVSIKPFCAITLRLIAIAFNTSAPIQARVRSTKGKVLFTSSSIEPGAALTRVIVLLSDGTDAAILARIWVAWCEIILTAITSVSFGTGTFNYSKKEVLTRASI
jgi:hypothetical protein